jgi:hypothetical protein
MTDSLKWPWTRPTSPFEGARDWQDACRQRSGGGAIPTPVIA